MTAPVALPQSATTPQREESSVIADVFSSSQTDLNREHGTVSISVPGSNESKRESDGGTPLLYRSTSASHNPPGGTREGSLSSLHKTPSAPSLDLDSFREIILPEGELQQLEAEFLKNSESPVGSAAATPLLSPTTQASYTSLNPLDIPKAASTTTPSLPSRGSLGSGLANAILSFAGYGGSRTPESSSGGSSATNSPNLSVVEAPETAITSTMDTVAETSMGTIPLTKPVPRHSASLSSLPSLPLGILSDLSEPVSAPKGTDPSLIQPHGKKKRNGKEPISVVLPSPTPFISSFSSSHSENGSSNSNGRDRSRKYTAATEWTSFPPPTPTPSSSVCSSGNSGSINVGGVSPSTIAISLDKIDNTQAVTFYPEPNEVNLYADTPAGGLSTLTRRLNSTPSLNSSMFRGTTGIDRDTTRSSIAERQSLLSYQSGTQSTPDVSSSEGPVDRLGPYRALLRKGAKLGEYKATALCGNDATGSVLYMMGPCVAAAGALAPVAVALVSAVLYLFRAVYGEAVTSLPLNGGAYNVLLNTTRKSTAAVAAVLTLLSYTATAVVSSAEATHYLQHALQFDAGLIAPGTLGLLGIFAAITCLGVGESASVALGILLTHLASLTLLCVVAAYRVITDVGLEVLKHNIALLDLNWGALGRGVFFGFSSAMLGVTGFETSANYVEEQKRGVYVKTLRNMWWMVTIYNFTIACLTVLLLPVDEVVSNGFTATVVAHLARTAAGGRNGGRSKEIAPISALFSDDGILSTPMALPGSSPNWLETIVALDAFLVLAGGVLTSFVGVTGLARRLALDRCLPQGLLRTNTWRGTNHWIIIFFAALCGSMFLALEQDVRTLGETYSVSFLSVMALFALGVMMIKVKRPSLAKQVAASWPTTIIAFLSVLLALYGAISRDATVVKAFLLYFSGFFVVVLGMLHRARLMRAGVLMLRAFPCSKAYIRYRTQYLLSLYAREGECEGKGTRQRDTQESFEVSRNATNDIISTGSQDSTTSGSPLWEAVAALDHAAAIEFLEDFHEQHQPDKHSPDEDQNPYSPHGRHFTEIPGIPEYENEHDENENGCDDEYNHCNEHREGKECENKHHLSSYSSIGSVESLASRAMKIPMPIPPEHPDSSICLTKLRYPQRWLSFRVGAALVNASERLERSRRALLVSPMGFFAKKCELSVLNKAVQYVVQNEDCCWIRVIHCFTDEKDIPPTLYRDVNILAEEYPEMTIDLVLVKGAFTPAMVAYISVKLQISRNYLFITSPQPGFSAKLEDLGGVRLITH